jgi:hypothetical protein
MPRANHRSELRLERSAPASDTTAVRGPPWGSEAFSPQQRLCGLVNNVPTTASAQPGARQRSAPPHAVRRRDLELRAGILPEVDEAVVVQDGPGDLTAFFVEVGHPLVGQGAEQRVGHRSQLVVEVREAVPCPGAPLTAGPPTPSARCGRSPCDRAHARGGARPTALAEGGDGSAPELGREPGGITVYEIGIFIPGSSE